LRIFLVLASVIFYTTTIAASETKWVDHDGMLSTRLVAASADMSNEDGRLLAWEAKLASGWKTYWRSPGEAGLPVRIFINKKEVAPLYPLPERFELFGIQTFGYSHQLLLPFRLPQDADGQLKIDVDFMVCKEVCVPFKHEYKMQVNDIETASFKNDIRFETWLKKVPMKGTGAQYGLEILKARVAGKIGHQKLIVDVRGETNLLRADILAEVNDMFHFGIPKVQLLEDGKTARMVLSAMTGNTPENLRGKKVRLTFTDGKGAAIDRIIDLPK